MGNILNFITYFLRVNRINKTMLILMFLTTIAGIIYCFSARDNNNIEINTTNEGKILITEAAFFLFQMQ